MQNKINQAGRSMVEMLGVLAIIGVLSVGGIAGYQKAMMKYKTNQLVAKIVETVADVRTLYAGRQSYEGLSYYLGDTTFYNELRNAVNMVDGWLGGGAIENCKDYSTGEGCDYFSISLEELPEDVCKALALYDWGGENSTGLVAVYVGKGHLSTYFPDERGKMVDVSSRYVSSRFSGQNPRVVLFNSAYVPLTPTYAAEYCQCPDKDCTFGLQFK